MENALTFLVSNVGSGTLADCRTRAGCHSVLRPPSYFMDAIYATFDKLRTACEYVGILASKPYCPFRFQTSLLRYGFLSTRSSLAGQAHTVCWIGSGVFLANKFNMSRTVPKQRGIESMAMCFTSITTTLLVAFIQLCYAHAGLCTTRLCLCYMQTPFLTSQCTQEEKATFTS